MIKIKLFIISLCFLAIQESDAQWLNTIDTQNHQLHIQQLQAEQMREQERQRRWDDMNNRMYIQQMEMQRQDQHELTNRAVRMNDTWED